MERGKTITGARARFTIGGKKVGWATDVSLTEAVDYQEAIVLDDIEVAEHVPQLYRVRLSFGTLKLVGMSLKRLGLFPKGGAASGARLRNIINTAEMSAVIADSQSGEILEQVQGVKISERTLSISAGNIAGINITAVARSTMDQSEL